MQATVEDYEDVVPAGDAQMNGNELPGRKASTRARPAAEISSGRTKTASGGTGTTATSQPPAKPILDQDQSLKGLPRPEDLAPYRPIILECHTCKKPEPSIGAFIKCPFCKVTPYCQKSCKKDDKKEHKKHCARLGNKHSEKTIETVQDVQGRRDAAGSSIALDIRRLLHKFKPENAMELWIDAFRLWALENNDATGKCLNAGFEEFLNQLKERETYWAPWLHEKHGRKKCMALTQDKSSWYYLERPITNKELREHYDSKDCTSFLVSMAKVVHGELAI